jgi:hypothetical protein
MHASFLRGSRPNIHLDNIFPTDKLLSYEALVEPRGLERWLLSRAAMKLRQGAVTDKPKCLGDAIHHSRHISVDAA